MEKKFSIRKRFKSFVYAGKGTRSFLGSEHNAWVHCIAAVIVLAAGFLFKISRGEWIALVLCIGLVLAAEAFNTAIERLTDLVSPQKDPVAGDVKDIAAGAVLICAVTAAVTGAIIFVPYILEILKSYL